MDLEKMFIRLIKGKRQKVQVLWLEDVGSGPNSANYDVFLKESSVQ